MDEQCFSTKDSAAVNSSVLELGPRSLCVLGRATRELHPSPLLTQMPSLAMNLRSPFPVARTAGLNHKTILLGSF